MPVLRSRKNFAVGRRVINRGDLVSSTDPIVAGKEHLFDRVEDVVEQATAAPGEKRNVTVTPEKPEPDTEGHTCPDCGFVAASPAGLGAHRRSHSED